MGHQMEDAGHEASHPQPHHHVAQLADGGEGQDPLDVVLSHRDGGGEDSGETPDVGHHHQALRGLHGLEDREHPSHQVDASGHHGRGVNQRRDRRGSFHRIGKPHVQGELSRLTHRPAEDQKPHGGDQPRIALGVPPHPIEDVGVLDAAHVDVDEDQPQI